MRNLSFQRYVAIFVGVLLALAAVAAVVTQDESTVGLTLAALALYGISLSIYLRRKKEMQEKKPKQKESPLLRR